jgi:DNA repair exonuclease SbcCD ATPase subunit
MLKKSLVVGGAVVLLLGLFFGRDACSYLTTSVGWVKDTVKTNVPIEFQIDRARQMIKDLDPEIRRNMHLIAQEEVEVEKLAGQVEDQEAALAKARGDILRLKKDLETGDTAFYYASRRYTEDQVKNDLESRFERYQVNEATLEKNQKIHAIRLQKLASARQRLEEMLTAKRELEVQVENLEAELEMLKVARTASDFNIDNSRLARTKELIEDIRTRLQVEEKLMGEVQAAGQIPLEEETKSNEEITDRISKYFGENGAESYVELQK